MFQKPRDKIFPPKINIRKRLERKQLCREGHCNLYDDISVEQKTDNNDHEPYKFTIVRPNGQTDTLIIPTDSPIRKENNIVLYFGNLPIDALEHLYS
jgi:hypothetical protein